MRTCEDISAMLHRLADEAARIILPKFRTTFAIENKSTDRFDPVTEADRDAEAAIRKIINAYFPDDGIIGEEYGSERKNAEYVWVVDPIDGTRSFIQGLPVWGTLIGLYHEGKPHAGIMSQPYTGERFWSDSEGSYFRGSDGNIVPLVVREATLATAQMSTTDPYLFVEPAENAAFQALRAQVCTCRFGTDCYGYSLVAAGQIDVVLESGLQIYDIAALIPIIEKAGGLVTTWDGGAAQDGGKILACGDPELHSEVVEILQSISV